MQNLCCEGLLYFHLTKYELPRWSNSLIRGIAQKQFRIAVNLRKPEMHISNFKINNWPDNFSQQVQRNLKYVTSQLHIIYFLFSN